MKVVPKVIEINYLSTIQLEKNNHELDHIEKNILVHPNIPAPPPRILNGSPLISHNSFDITGGRGPWCSG